jgi:hypothetical protein
MNSADGHYVCNSVEEIGKNMLKIISDSILPKNYKISIQRKEYLGILSKT